MSMIKGFVIDYIRQVIEQTLLEEKLKNPKLFGGDDEVRLFSFYEQLATKEEVDRYIENYGQLIDQQNKTNLIMNGIIVTDENPTITNLCKGFIIPASFTGAVRVRIEDKDTAVETFNNLISVLKGRKQDIAGFSYAGDSNTEGYIGKPFKVGTIANSYEDNGLIIHNGDYLGDCSPYNVYLSINNKLSALSALGVLPQTNLKWVYVTNTATGGMNVAYYDNNTWTILEDDKTHKDIIFPPKGTFEKYKISMSFDSVKISEPRNIGGKEYIDITFGGSSTIVSEGMTLGNELVKVNIKRSTIKADTDITLTDTDHWLEPLEMPSGNSAGNVASQIASAKFYTKSHTDSFTLGLQYTFMVDMSESLISDMFNYARYGVQATIPQENTQIQGITPNIIYTVKEVWNSWADIRVYSFKAKIVNSVDIENTESDTLTMTIPLQIQGV